MQQALAVALKGSLPLSTSMFMCFLACLVSSAALRHGNSSDAEDSEAGPRSADEDDLEDGAGDEDDGSQGPSTSQRKRQRMQRQGSADNQDEGGGGPGGGDGSQRNKRPKRITREQLREKEQAVDEYYSNYNGYGKPSSLVLLGLCQGLRIDDNLHVWCVDGCNAVPLCTFWDTCRGIQNFTAIMNVMGAALSCHTSTNTLYSCTLALQARHPWFDGAAAAAPDQSRAL